ncbi:hypothetical protein HCH52_03815 [Oscillospiraceae bacterium HV4-5-C5C]|nr:hypothetical protein [Oscillospiraceae bacterium HV4-5-C5C]
MNTELTQYFLQRLTAADASRSHRWDHGESAAVSREQFVRGQLDPSTCLSLQHLAKRARVNRRQLAGRGTAAAAVDQPDTPGAYQFICALHTALLPAPGKDPAEWTDTEAGQIQVPVLLTAVLLTSDGKLAFSGLWTDLPWLNVDLLSPRAEPDLALTTWDHYADVWGKMTALPAWEPGTRPAWTDFLAAAEQFWQDLLGEAILTGGRAGVEQAEEKSISNQIDSCSDAGQIRFGQQTYLLDPKIHFFFDDRSMLYGCTEDLYTQILRQKPSLPLYERLFDFRQPETANPLSAADPMTKDQNSDGSAAMVRQAENQAELTIGQMKAHRGYLGSDAALSASQRSAEAKLKALSSGDFQTLLAPPGTGKHRLLMSLLADLLVESALREQPAPLIALVSPSMERLQETLSYFEKLAQLQEDLLDRRWIYNVNSLAVAFPTLGGSVPGAAQSSNQNGQGFWEILDNPTNLAKSEAYFRAQLSRYLGREIPSLHVAETLLHLLLQQLDDLRCRMLDTLDQIKLETGGRKLSDAYAGLAAETESLAEQVREQKNRREQHDLQESTDVARLADWESRYSRLPWHYRIFAGWKPNRRKIDQALREYVNQREREALPEQLTIQVIRSLYQRFIEEDRQGTAEAVAALKRLEGQQKQLVERTRRLKMLDESYREQLESLDDYGVGFAAETEDLVPPAQVPAKASEAQRRMERLRRAARESADATLAEEVLAAEPSTDAGGQRELDWPQRLRLKTALLEAQLEDLNPLLDTRVRRAEAWLAIHYYEARFLSGEFMSSTHQRGTAYPAVLDKFYHRLALVTPLLVMNLHETAGQFRTYLGAAGQYGYLFNQIDWLLLDEAEATRPEEVLAPLALAKRAVIVAEGPAKTDLLPLLPTRLNRALQEQAGLTAEAIAALRRTSCFNPSLAFSEWQALPAPVLLQEQWRSYAELIQWGNATLYAGKLKSMRGLAAADPSYLLKWPALAHYPAAATVSQGWGAERCNAAEARALAVWLKRYYPQLLSVYQVEGIEPERARVLAVLTPFAAQAAWIRQSLADTLGQLADYIEVSTLSQFSGQSRRLIIVLPVYGQDENPAWFLAHPDIWNLAMLSAEDAFWIWGEPGAVQADERPGLKLLRRLTTPTLLEVETVDCKGEALKLPD